MKFHTVQIDEIEPTIINYTSNSELYKLPTDDQNNKTDPRYSSATFTCL